MYSFFGKGRRAALSLYLLLTKLHTDTLRSGSPARSIATLSTSTRANPLANRMLFLVGLPETTMPITTSIKIPPSAPASAAAKTFEFQNRPALKMRGLSELSLCISSPCQHAAGVVRWNRNVNGRADARADAQADTLGTIVTRKISEAEVLSKPDARIGCWLGRRINREIDARASGQPPRARGKPGPRC